MDSGSEPGLAAGERPGVEDGGWAASIESCAVGSAIAAVVRE